jgi:hypothetical protein
MCDLNKFAYGNEQILAIVMGYLKWRQECWKTKLGVNLVIEMKSVD